jgi:hypothetical protein
VGCLLFSCKIKYKTAQGDWVGTEGKINIEKQFRAL